MFAESSSNKPIEFPQLLPVKKNNWQQDCGEIQTGKAKESLHSYVLFSYAHIAEALLTEDDAYTNTIYKALNTPDTNSCREMLLILLEAYERIPDFATAVVTLSEKE